MKKLLANIGGKVAALADDIASYNDSSRCMGTSKPQAPSASGGSGVPPEPEGPLDPVLEQLLRNVRSRYVRQHVARTSAAEYTQLQSVTIQAATFNVAGKKPPPGLRLEEWLGVSPATAAGDTKGCWAQGAGEFLRSKGAPTEEAEEAGAAVAIAPVGGNGDGPDVLAVGFAEIVPLSAGNVMGVWGSTQVDAWDRCLAVYLNGEEWATQRYGPSAPAAASHAAAAAAAISASSLLETKWQGCAATPDAESTVVGPNGSNSGSGGGGAAAATAGNSAGSGGNASGGSGPSEGEYVQVASKQLVGVYLSVWVRRRLLPAVRGVQVTTVATGFGGYLGNKGAVAARMRLYDSSLVFVASHLTAGDADGDELRRNADVHDILRRAVFAGAPADGVGVGGGVAMTGASAALISASLGSGHWPATSSGITDHDLVIWVGDLNYRISTVPTAVATASPAVAAGGDMTATTTTARPVGHQGVLTDADVRAAIRAGRLEPLLAADQLNRERAAGRVFQGWHEGRLTFLPTYKFKVGTNTYNGDELPTSGSAGSLLTAMAAGAPAAADAGIAATVAEELESSAASTGNGNAADAEKYKRRTPAWCDRVLWWTKFRATAQQQRQQLMPGLRQLAYWRGELNVSDHKPVAAAFVAAVVSYDRRRIEGLVEAAMRAVDRMQESQRPRVTVDPVVLEAGEWVALGRPQPLRLQIINTGGVEALFHFVPPPQEPNPSRKGPGSKFGLDDETPPLPPWLEAQPAEGVVPPGQSCEVLLTVLVEGGGAGAAAQLSLDGPTAATASATASLDSILILRIEDSGDKFISIGGRFRRSFLGMPLEALSRLGSRPALLPTEAAALAAKLGLGQLQPQLAQQPPQQLLLQEGDGGAALGPSGAAAAGADGDGDDGNVVPPKEIHALVSALMANSAAALRLPGILVDSAALVLAREGYEAAATTTAAAVREAKLPGQAGEEAAVMQPVGREAQRALIRILEPLRLILDAGGRVPESADPHEVVALLLLWCGQLPYPLIPATVADVAVAAPPTSPADAQAMLRRHCNALQLAVVSELLRLLRTALAPGLADCNGLTAGRLAATAAAWWMPPLAAGSGAGAASGQRTLLALLLSDGGNTAATAAGLSV